VDLVHLLNTQLNRSSLVISLYTPLFVVFLFEVTVVGVRLGTGLLPGKDLSLRLPTDVKTLTAGEGLFEVTIVGVTGDWTAC